MKPCLELVRYSLNPEAQLALDPANIDWEGLFRFADEQAILGVVFEGVKRMNERLEVKEQEVMDLVLEWAIVAHQIEEQNKRVNEAAAQVSKVLKKNGFKSCILKGQGNALLYPNPYLRNPGDIDVWAKCDGRGKTADVRRVIRFVKKVNPGAQGTYHHIDGGECNGVAIEVHYRPSFMTNPFYNHRLQRWFERMAPEQFAHEVELPDDAGEIAIPTHDFNLIFLLSHIYRHVLYEGIGLRQFVDYYYLLRSEDERLEVGDERLAARSKWWKNTLRHLGMERIAGAVMWVLHEVLGLEEKYLIAPMNEKLGKVLLEEILRGGNFGKYDADNIKADSQLKKNWQRIKRDARLMWYFPSEALCEPFFRTWHFFWRVRYN